MKATVCESFLNGTWTKQNKVVKMSWDPRVFMILIDSVHKLWSFEWPFSAFVGVLSTELKAVCTDFESFHAGLGGGDCVICLSNPREAGVSAKLTVLISKRSLDIRAENTILDSLQSLTWEVQTFVRYSVSMDCRLRYFIALHSECAEISPDMPPILVLGGGTGAGAVQFLEGSRLATSGRHVCLCSTCAKVTSSTWLWAYLHVWHAFDDFMSCCSLHFNMIFHFCCLFDCKLGPIVCRGPSLC